MNIVCLSDLHGHLPVIEEDFDLLLISGDICPLKCHTVRFQRRWLLDEFGSWLDSIPTKKVITWGNHDKIAEDNPYMVPALNADILIDDLCEWEGLHIYGLPWQRRFFDWAFNLDEPELSHKYDIIPDCDIIISHGPPYYYGDYTSRDKTHCGCPAFNNAIERIEPALVVYGHIHEGSGSYRLGDSTLINASIMTHRYEPINPIRCFHLSESYVPTRRACVPESLEFPSIEAALTPHTPSPSETKATPGSQSDGARRESAPLHRPRSQATYYSRKQERLHPPTIGCY